MFGFDSVFSFEHFILRASGLIHNTIIQWFYSQRLSAMGP